MTMLPIHIQRLRPGAQLPSYSTAQAAGADLHACIDAPMVIDAGETVLVPTGFAMALPEGYAGLIYARSGMACKRGLAPANKVGVIDSDYRGEIIVVLHNHGKESQTVTHGERIAQMVITPVLTPGFTEVDELSDTKRGNGGFGSTGK